MAGFYGNISHSNKTAINFDKIYHTRKEMSATGDGVFIGRYVLIDYDESPIQGYYINGSFWTTQAIPESPSAQNSARIANITDVYYLDLATNRFYLYNAPDAQLGGGGYQQVTSPSGYAYYYNVDVKQYGRGYDGTVWTKVYDAEKKQYKYVMIAELNTVVPNFHLVAEQPAMAPIAPWFDSNLTNIDYYLHLQQPLAIKIREKNETASVAANRRYGEDDAIHSSVVTYSGSSALYGQTATVDTTGTYVPAIYYFKDGFSAANHTSPKTTTNKIAFDWEQSGRIYGQTPFTAGTTANDIMSWYIQLPNIGITVSDFFDQAYGYTTDRTTNNRFRNILQENNTSVAPSSNGLVSEAVNGNNPYATVNPNTMIGIINSTRQYLGRVNALGSTRSATIAKDEDDTNIMCYKDNGTTRTYYIPQYARTWTQTGTVGAKTGDNSKPYYIKNGNIYKLANLNAQSSTTPVYQPSTTTQLIWPILYSSVGTTKGASGENAIAADASANNFGTIYGAIAYMHKIFGSHLLDQDSRDERTVIGLMNRMRDTIANVDTQIIPNRIMISNSNGVITSASHTIKVAQQSTSTTTTLTGTSSAAQSFSYVNTSKDITLVTKNKWIVIDLDTANQYIQFAHELSPLTGTSAGTEIKSSATGWGTASSNNDNIITIPTFTFDKGGHLTATSTVSFYLPHSFKTFKLTEQSVEVSQLETIAQPNNIVADNSADTFTFATGNKWIRMATDANADKITIAHALSSLTNITAGTEIKASATGWGTSNSNTDNIITIPTFTFDQAGHVTASSTVSFYLPHSWKTIATAKQSDAVTDSSGNNAAVNVIADTSADTLTLATSNKWITILGNATDDKITFGHRTSGVTATSYGLAQNEDVTTLDVDNIFEVPYFTVDAAGHITDASTKTVAIPESFGKVTIGSQSTETTDMAANTASIEADSIYDEFVLQSGNKWIKLAATANSDLIQIAHAVNTITTSTNNTTFNGETDTFTNDFELDLISYDAAGHITSKTHQGYKLPYGYKTISVSNASNTSTNTVIATAGNCIAGSIIDTLNISTGNQWLIYAANTSNNTITLGHKLITASYVGSYGDTSAQTPVYGGTFKVPYLTIDEAGHVTAISEHTVTIPLGSITNTDNGNVVTNVSFTDSSNAITINKSYVGDLTLTNYTIAATVADIAAADSINTAFGKIQLALNTLNSNLSDEATTRADADSNLNNDLSDEITARENGDAALSLIISGDPEDDESTGLIGRINALENANTAEEDRIGALEDIINDIEEEDPEDPNNTIIVPGLESRVDALEAIDIQSMISAAINDIFTNFEMSLKAPLLTIANTNGILNVTVNNVTENDILTYQWQTRADATSDWENIQDATENEYDTTVNEEYGDFRCVVERSRNSYNSTANAIITVLAPEPEPEPEPEPSGGD